MPLIAASPMLAAAKILLLALGSLAPVIQVGLSRSIINALASGALDAALFLIGIYPLVPVLQGVISCAGGAVITCITFGGDTTPLTSISPRST